MKNKNHTFNCYTYCNRVYDIIQKISQIDDQRVNPKIKLPPIVLTVIFSIMSGLHSFHAMEGAIKDGDFDKFFNFAALPSADTISYVLSKIDLNDLKEIVISIIQKARYNKSLKINTVLRNNKDAIVRVKQENNLIENAEGLFQDTEADYSYENVTPKDRNLGRGILYDIDIWDAEGFSWSDVDQSLRVLKVKERKKKVNASGKLIKEETQISYFASTMEAKQLKPFTVWKIAHRRWDEENGVFHWLKTHWNFDHIYSHDPHIIQAMYYLYIIAYNLFHLYIHRNLRSFDPELESKKKFMRRFYKGLVTLPEPLYYPEFKAG